MEAQGLQPPDIQVAIRTGDTPTDVRRSMERQISLQVHDIPEERYRGLVRPRLERALLEAGLTQADADCVLGGVDYHRSL